MENMDIFKVTSLDKLSGRFLKAGAEVLVNPLNKLRNL